MLELNPFLRADLCLEKVGINFGRVLSLQQWKWKDHEIHKQETVHETLFLGEMGHRSVE